MTSPVSYVKCRVCTYFPIRKKKKLSITLPKRSENLHSHKNPCASVSSGFMCTHQTPETTEMSLGCRVHELMARRPCKLKGAP